MILHETYKVYNIMIIIMVSTLNVTQVWKNQVQICFTQVRTFTQLL